MDSEIKDVHEANTEQVDVPLKKEKKGKKIASGPNENIRDFGMFTGTATSEGTLDVKKFIDNAMELPTFKKKYQGIKLERKR